MRAPEKAIGGSDSTELRKLESSPLLIHHLFSEALRAPEPRGGNRRDGELFLESPRRPRPVEIDADSVEILRARHA